eukprot:3208281-Amphidinium_carterae.1
MGKDTKTVNTVGVAEFCDLLINTVLIYGPDYRSIIKLSYFMFSTEDKTPGKETKTIGNAQ